MAERGELLHGQELPVVDPGFGDSVGQVLTLLEEGFHKYEKASDVEGFHEKINLLATDKEYYKQASENSKFISEFYSKENVAKIWREYYPRVWEKHQSKRNKKK